MQDIRRYTDEAAPSAPKAAAEKPPRRWLWQGKIPDAFWKAATLFSFVVNLILVLVLAFVGLLIFRIKSSIAQPLVGGLHTSFVEMDNSTIRATIPVSDTLPVEFDLPLNTTTTVTLTEPTVIPETTVYLNGIPIKTLIVLPANTPLTIKLALTVPVRQVVPVRLMVDAVIPLDQTELHIPFSRLRHLFEPYVNLLKSLPDNWEELFAQITGRQ